MIQQARRYRKNKKRYKKVDQNLHIQIAKMKDQVEKMSWLNTHYKILHDFSQTCSKTLSEEILLKKAYELVSQVMPTDAYFFATYNEGDEDIEIIFMVDGGDFYPPDKIEFGDNFTSRAIKTRKIIHNKIEDKYEIAFGNKLTISHLFVPLLIDDQVKGLISAQSFNNYAYRKEHEELLKMIGTQVINSISTARLYRKIFIMSQTDELTGLKNHRAFHNDLAQLIHEEKNITLLMLDSDNLKKVNDNYGHNMGDLYLKELSMGIKSICSPEVEGYRYAGDEFMIILKSKSKKLVEDLYQKLLDYYSSNPVKSYEREISVSFSAGVAMYPENGLSVDSLKKSADAALYQAKDKGKNQLVTACNLL